MRLKIAIELECMFWRWWRSLNSKMDVAYINGPSNNNHKELKLSIRSLSLVPHRNLYVVGTNPGWLNEQAIFIPNDPQGKNDDKAWIIKEQLLKVCDSGISDDFMLMNDDVFFIREQDEFPYLHKGQIQDSLNRLKSGVFYGHLLATKVALEKKKLPTLHFDGHWPIIYNKKKLREVIESQDWSVALGPTIRSMYCNTLGITGEYADDIKANKKENWTEWTKGMSVFSTGDESFDKSCERFLLNLFPNKSKYEL